MMQLATFAPDTRQKSAGRRGWAATGVMVAGTLAVALASYSLSLKVSAERAETAKLARQNVALERELKGLEAELRVRMRLPQLQRWNDEVLALKPITAPQYLDNPVYLAAYGTQPEMAAPVFQLTARTDVATRAAGPSLALTAAVLPQPSKPAASTGRELVAKIARAPAAPAFGAAPAKARIDPMLVAAIDAMAARESAAAPQDLLRQVDLPTQPPGN